MAESDNSSMVAIFAIIAIIVVLGGAFLLYKQNAAKGTNGANINVTVPSGNGGTTSTGY